MVAVRKEDVEAPFKKGDIVTLKSGGPDMTVIKVHNPGIVYEDWVVKTSWFAGKKNEHGSFPPEALVLADDDDPK